MGAFHWNLCAMFPNASGLAREGRGGEKGRGSVFAIENCSLCESTSEPKMYLVNWLWEVEALNNESLLRGLNNMNKE